MIAMEELEVVDGWMLWYPSTVSENVTYTATTHSHRSILYCSYVL